MKPKAIVAVRCSHVGCGGWPKWRCARKTSDTSGLCYQHRLKNQGAPARSPGDGAAGEPRV